MATLRCGDREIDIYDIVSSDSARWWWDARWQSAKDEMPPDADTLEAIDAALEVRAREGRYPCPHVAPCC